MAHTYERSFNLPEPSLHAQRVREFLFFTTENTEALRAAQKKKS